MEASRAALRALSMSMASGGIPKSAGWSTSKDGERRLWDLRYSSTFAVFVETLVASSAILVLLIAAFFTIKMERERGRELFKSSKE